MIWSLILHVFGVEPRTPSTAYNWWSGAGSDVGEFAIAAAAWHFLNCHEPRCRRLGVRHVLIDGCTYRVCRSHHPTHGDGRGQLAADYHNQTTTKGTSNVQ
jgi:hypothetical protein